MRKNAPPSKDKRLATKPDHKSYAVGYGKPPSDARFKPGQSGNPRGRPRAKSKPTQLPQDERLKVIILEEAYRAIKVKDGDKQVTVPMAQAIVRSLAVTAAKGNTRAQRTNAPKTKGLKPQLPTNKSGKTSLSAASTSTSRHQIPFRTPTTLSSICAMERS